MHTCNNVQIPNDKKRKLVGAAMLIGNISVIIVRLSDKSLLSISFIIYSLNPLP